MSIISNKKDNGADRNLNISTMGSGDMSGSKSVIGNTMSINGDLQADEEVTIEGKVKGTIKISSLLIVGHQGYVNAEIKAREVVIQGKAEGNITATERVEILANGEFLGDVNSKKLIIKEGAIFKGNVNMEDSPGKPFSTFKPDKPPEAPISEKKPDK
jgi:cytoskeletal protein CcmA (bactofilin family)